MGADGFEPPKSKDSRFTVCPIWPLWKTPVSKASAKVDIFFQTAKCFAEKKSLPPSHCPSAEHREEVKPRRAALLDAHGRAEGYPSAGLVAWDAQGLIGPYARESAYILDIPLRVVLINN